MLVLSRTRGQAIIIRDEIEVVVVDVRGDKVRLGIAAPRDVTVHRKEVYEAIRAENRLAAEVRPEDMGGMVELVGKVQRHGHGTGDAAGEVMEDSLMALARQEAMRSQSQGGVPVGAVLVRGGRVIGRGHNRRVQSGNPTAHAELECLAEAGMQGAYADTVMYTTLSPCWMCAGALVQLGVGEVVIADTVHSTGAVEFLRDHGVRVRIRPDDGCIDMLERFIQSSPEVWQAGLGHPKRPAPGV